jgi:hypothetical protein
MSIQYIKNSNKQHMEIIERNSFLSQQAQQLPPTECCIADSLNLSAELIINNKKVSSDLTTNIRSAYATPKLWEYYQDKFNWTQECIQSIDWTSHGNALNTLRSRQKKTIIQFNHCWLPLNTSHSLQATDTARLCPYCTQTDETHQHYLSCNHPTTKHTWSTNIQQLQDRIQKYNKHLNKIIIKLIILAITEWRTTPHPPRPSFVTPQYYDLFQQQSTIGWNQIIHGRFATTWNTLQTSFSTKVPINWLTYIIRTIWHNMYEIWKHRCNVNIGITPNDKRQREILRLTPKIQSLYNKINLVSPEDIDVIFNHTYDEMLLLPPHTIDKWIYQAESRIAASIKRQKQQTITTTHPIKKFFQRIIPPTNYQRPPQRQPPAPNVQQTYTQTIKTFITNTINTFFPIRQQYHDPYIPIPKSDYRPP